MRDQHSHLILDHPELITFAQDAFTQMDGPNKYNNWNKCLWFQSQVLDITHLLQHWSDNGIIQNCCQTRIGQLHTGLVYDNIGWPQTQLGTPYSRQWYNTWMKPLMLLMYMTLHSFIVISLTRCGLWYLLCLLKGLMLHWMAFRLYFVTKGNSMHSPRAPFPMCFRVGNFLYTFDRTDCFFGNTPIYKEKNGVKPLWVKQDLQPMLGINTHYLHISDASLLKHLEGNFACVDFKESF